MEEGENEGRLTVGQEHPHLPLSALNSPAKAASKELLPDPTWPTTAVSWPRGTARETSEMQGEAPGAHAKVASASSAEHSGNMRSSWGAGGKEKALGAGSSGEEEEFVEEAVAWGCEGGR